MKSVFTLASRSAVVGFASSDDDDYEERKQVFVVPEVAEAEWSKVAVGKPVMIASITMILPLPVRIKSV